MVTPVKVPAGEPSLVTPTGEKVEESWLRFCGPPGTVEPMATSTGWLPRLSATSPVAAS